VGEVSLRVEQDIPLRFCLQKASSFHIHEKMLRTKGQSERVVCAMSEKRQRYSWTRELDLLLEQGYRSGFAGRRSAINRVLRLTGWSRQACWDRARKLGLSRNRGSFRRWSEREEDFLVRYAGLRSVRQLALQLDRTEKSVREKLAGMRIGSRLGISARVTDGHTKTELAQFLGRSPQTVQRWIDRGWLKGRHEGKQRQDDTLRVTDEDFRSFWKKHSWEVPFHTLSRDGMEWFFSVMIDIPLNAVRGDPLARWERRRRKTQLMAESHCKEETTDSEASSS
jgi:hypothetical protein